MSIVLPLTGDLQSYYITILGFIDWYKDSSFTSSKILAGGIWFCQLLYFTSYSESESLYDVKRINYA